LSKFGVIIYVNFSINTIEGIAWIHSPWVDFQLSTIELDKQIVEVLELFLGLSGNRS